MMDLEHTLGDYGWRVMGMRCTDGVWSRYWSDVVYTEKDARALKRKFLSVMVGGEKENWQNVRLQRVKVEVLREVIIYAQ